MRSKKRPVPRPTRKPTPKPQPKPRPPPSPKPGPRPRPQRGAGTGKFPPGPIKRVVIMIQENHTTDNYFRGLAPWGAKVVTNLRTCPNPAPTPPFSVFYPPHHRRAYF